MKVRLTVRDENKFPESEKLLSRVFTEYEYCGANTGLCLCSDNTRTRSEALLINYKVRNTVLGFLFAREENSHRGYIAYSVKYSI